MKRSAKAALLSGLIFPGVGQILLKHYLRASIFILAALMSLSVTVTEAVKRTLTIVDRISSGEVPVDPGAIADLASGAPGGASGSILNIAALVFVVCWLGGIIDAYRLGVLQEK